MTVRDTPPPEDQPATAQNQEPAAPPSDKSKQAEEPAGAEEVTEDKAEGQEGEVVESPSTAPHEIIDQLELFPALRTDGETQYKSFKSRWNSVL